MAWDTLADSDSIDRTIAALVDNGIKATLVQTGAEARDKVLSMIPPGDEVMNMTSKTLTAVGLDKDVMESGRYQATKNTLSGMDRSKDALEAYGPGTTTFVNKLLIFNGEKIKDRITLILVNEVLGV